MQKGEVFSAFFSLFAEISYCSVNPCRNGGECRPIGTGTQGGCVCKHGYSGQYCEGRKRIMYVSYEMKCIVCNLFKFD